MITYKSNVGEVIDIYFDIIDCGGNQVFTDTPSAIIKSNNKYYNLLFFQSEQCQVGMKHIGDGRYHLAFTPDVEGAYFVQLKSDAYKCSDAFIYIVGNADSDSCTVTHETLIGSDGGDAKVIDKNGKPVMGVQIQCYNAETKSLECVTSTDALGEWSLTATPGKKIFLFSKDKYNSVSIEREV